MCSRVSAPDFIFFFIFQTVIVVRAQKLNCVQRRLRMKNGSAAVRNVGGS